MNSIIKKLNLFWQYPVITEKTFNDQHIHNDLFIGFPWATIIDSKEINSPNIINALLKYIDKTIRDTLDSKRLLTDNYYTLPFGYEE